MSLEKFAHVFPAMVTPMNENGSFNYDTAKKHLDWMNKNGIGGVGILMAAGEYQSVSIEEHKEYCDVMVPYAKEKGMSVIIGASRERVEDVVTIMNNAYATGAIGWISMTANILPKLSADFHNAMIVEKDYQKGLEIYKQLYPVVNMTERYAAPTQAVKHILSEIYGFEEGICRRPRREISDADKKLVVDWSEIKELSKTNIM